MSRWIALHCGDEAEALQARHPNAFLLLCQIARRAKWKDCPITRLKAGQAFIGDWREAGLHSEMAYRIAKQRLEDCGLATFQPTNKGTRATLANEVIFSISPPPNNGQGNGQGNGLTTDKERSSNRQGTTNHTDTPTTQSTLIFQPLSPTEERHLPKGWQKMSKDERKRQRVESNSPTMITLNGFFGRKPETLWNVADAVALMEIKPTSDEIETIGRFYALPVTENMPFRRKGISTLLNYWTGKYDKANGYFADNKPAR